MAGWRVGFCLGNPKMIGALARIKSYLDYGIFQPLQIASIIALRECEEETKKICGMYQRRRDVLVDGLNRAGLASGETEGLDVPVGADSGNGSANRVRSNFQKALLEKALVAVSPGIGFGPMGEGHVRFALIENFPPNAAGDTFHQAVSWQGIIGASPRSKRSSGCPENPDQSLCGREILRGCRARILSCPSPSFPAEIYFLSAE